MTKLKNGAIEPPPFPGTWTEPTSNATANTAPVYPYNNITQTESGHSIELDDTPNGERIRVQHGKSNTFFEMNASGDFVIRIERDGYEIIAGNKNVSVNGTCNITIAGDCNMQVQGNMNTQVNGDYNLTVAGKTNIRSVGELSLSSDDDVDIAANENFEGAVRISAGDQVYLDAELFVGGSATCDSLTAESRVNAGMGMTAGPFGFTSGLGGLSLGFPTPLTPVAVPGSINTVGPITSLISVSAPLGNFLTVTCGTMDAVWMTDVINTKIFDTHQHIAPFGITSPPLSQML